jgi:hypothetical protein
MKDGNLTYKVIEQYSATGYYNIISVSAHSATNPELGGPIFSSKFLKMRPLLDLFKNPVGNEHDLCTDLLLDKLVDLQKV